MFSHLRLASRCLRPCSRPSRIHPGRSFSSTIRTRSALGPEPPTDAEAALEAALAEQEAMSGEQQELEHSVADAEATADPETYNDFMDMIGFQFKHADGPRKWLGGQVPFPMNPSFKPPPPVSDALRTTIYDEFMKDPVNSNVRALSQRYHLSLKRVDAILRLKGMERAWIKGKTLQTGFRDGMEKILGVEPFAQPQSHTSGRYDAHEADTLEQEERRDASRQRYQRLYWESVPEDGREPIVPASLEHAKVTAKRFARTAEDSKSNEKLMPRIKDTETIKTPKSKVQIITRPGRPAMKFVDVGGKFIEVDERLRRMAEAERRAKIKVKKAIEKKAETLDRRRTSRRS